MSDSVYKLVVVRDDGVSHSSEFAGWHAETAAYLYFNKAKDEKRTLYAVLFYRLVDCSTFHPRSEWSRAAVQIAEALKGTE